MARLLRGNSDIVMQMHYTTNGTTTKDRTTVGVIYAKQPPTRLRGGGMVLNPRFVIPPTTATPRSRATTTLSARHDARRR